MAERRQPPAALRIEVTYALPGEQVLIGLDVEEGTTVREAIERSGIPSRFPGARIVAGNVGIFGRPVGLDVLVRSGDRVEIYRALIADPKQARRERAKRPGKAARR